MFPDTHFTLTLFTNSADLASEADQAGIDRIGVDLERVGKDERQGHLATWISDHTERDIELIRPSIRTAKLFARCNPIHAHSPVEIDRLIAAGVSVVMLPFFRTTGEVEQFIDLIGGRAEPVLLVETAEAARQIPAICHLPGVREIHFGLNDLRLSLGWASHFHVLISDLLRDCCQIVRDAGIKLGIGGLGRVGDSDLPIQPDLVSARIISLGATASLISRAFFCEPASPPLAIEIRKLRAWLAYCASADAAWHARHFAQLRESVMKRFGSIY